MDQTARIGLPFIVPEQALKHVTHNQALGILDALVQLSVKDRDLTAPPGAPAEGDAYIVGAAATGDWTGEDDALAVWQAGGWAFLAPNEGWLAWIEDEDALVGWDGAGWVSAGGGVNPTALVGVNATADTTNRLAVRSNGILFDAIDAAESGDGDCRVKVNKETAGDTATYLFQTGFSGRGEVGLAGDDDFHFKVSPDGASWYEGIVLDRATGRASFPNTPGRETLTANRTYYVRTDGDDGNTGLVDDAGGAFLTISAAINAVAALDMSTFEVVIQVGDGTYTDVVVLKRCLGPTRVILRGNTTTPTDCMISTTLSCITGSDCGAWKIEGFGLENSGNANLIGVFSGADIQVGAMDYGDCGGASHVHLVGPAAKLAFTADYTISGGATWQHVNSSGPGASVVMWSRTATFTANVTFTRFVQVSLLGLIDSGNMTFDLDGNTCTCARYNGVHNSVIQTAGGGANYFPGTSAGALSTGAIYG